MMTKKCKTCGLHKDGYVNGEAVSYCSLNKIAVDPLKDFCSRHTEDLATCGICHNPLLSYNIYVNEDRHFPICGQCEQKSGTCLLCKNSSYCDFEQNTSCSLPKIVVKTVQNGNMTCQIQGKNEEREKMLCVNCGCWNGKYCNRENLTCGSYECMV